MVQICSVANIGHLCSEQCLTSYLCDSDLQKQVFGFVSYPSSVSSMGWVLTDWWQDISIWSSLSKQGPSLHFKELGAQSPQNIQNCSGWIILPLVIIPFFIFFSSKTSRTSLYSGSFFFLVGFCLDSLFYYFSDFWGGSGVQFVM